MDDLWFSEILKIKIELIDDTIVYEFTYDISVVAPKRIVFDISSDWFISSDVIWDEHSSSGFIDILLGSTGNITFTIIDVEEFDFQLNEYVSIGMEDVVEIKYYLDAEAYELPEDEFGGQGGLGEIDIWDLWSSEILTIKVEFVDEYVLIHDFTYDIFVIIPESKKHAHA